VTVSLDLPFVDTYGTYASAGSVLDALGDPTRRRILEVLRNGERAVGDIASDLPVSRPAVSQHLRVLKGAGLVTDRPHGTRHLYSIDGTGLAALRAYLETFWDQALSSFRDVAERPGTGRDGRDGTEPREGARP
jgi:DNA-binding transcriptional ArsR family regulator